jgi:hypothetical protein
MPFAFIVSIQRIGVSIDLEKEVLKRGEYGKKKEET